jgi:hypothetical protein
VIATITTYVSSVRDKAFGNYSSCAKHTVCGRYNWCRDQGARVEALTNIVGRNDRNVGGRQPQAAAPIPDTDISDPDDSAGDDDSHSEPGQLEPGESGSGFAMISRIVTLIYLFLYPNISLHKKYSEFFLLLILM